MLAEAAQCDGFDVIALDVFGDADTRRGGAWHAIGAPLRIDAELFLHALQSLARCGAIGWVMGAGFDSEPDLLSRGAQLLPLIGTACDAARRVRDPQTFFAALDRHGIAHPPTRFSPPDNHDGWLGKSAHGSGGWHIRRAAPAGGDGRYWQRDAPGAPMSALFVANRRSARVLGFNRLIVRPIGASPYVYCGAIGPVPLEGKAEREVLAAIGALVVEFELAGLASLDFLLQGEVVAVLEVNPRPSASMALYPRGTMRAHVDACLHDRLLTPLERTSGVAGTEIVYAPAPIDLSPEQVARLAAQPDCHDLPFAAAHFSRNDPLCSVSARGADAASVATMLAARHNAVLQTLGMQ